MGQAGTRESGSADGQFDSELAPPEPSGNDLPDTAVDGPSAVERAEAIAAPARPRKAGAHWRVLAAISALILTALTIAGVYLLTKKPSTVDQLVILTVPSGAEISLDSKDYGHSPVKLEQLPIGTYTLTITKEGFEPIVKQVTISESQPLEFKLKPLPPSGTAELPPEEAVRQYQQQAEEALARGYYGLIYEGSALNYADLIIELDGANPFALEMRERVRKTAHQSAQAAVSRADLAQAQEIYKFLTENYADDEEARAAATKIETQLSNRRGELRGLVRKAEEALQAGNLIEPKGASAYYYSKQALAITQDAEARRVHNQVRDRLVAQSEQAFARGDAEGAIKQLEQITPLFKDDKQLRTRLREMNALRTAELAKAIDPNTHRVRGLDLYQKDDFGAAIPELQTAMVNGMGGPEVVFALARSYMKIGELDKAASYFRRVPESADASYRSSIAALGEILENQGNAAAAAEKYKEARRLGGSTLYTIAALNDKIEKIERRERERAAEPIPLTIQVRHLHGGLLGRSCAGPLTVNSTGVRYEGNEHQFSANLVGVSVRISKDEMSVQFQSSQKFKVARSEAERFRENLARFQQVYSPGNK
ncbi:MAG: PEGA domain-containing protein [Blastocatellia bacterium]